MTRNKSFTAPRGGWRAGPATGPGPVNNRPFPRRSSPPSAWTVTTRVTSRSTNGSSRPRIGANPTSG